MSLEMTKPKLSEQETFDLEAKLIFIQNLFKRLFFVSWDITIFGICILPVN